LNKSAEYRCRITELNDEPKQLVNLSHPVEFNFEELKILQGHRTKIVKSIHNWVTQRFVTISILTEKLRYQTKSKAAI
jgi:hypothetical protein